MIKNKVKSDHGEATDWLLILLTSIFFGHFGIDRFLMGHLWLGTLKLLTLGGLGIWWITDIILITGKHNFKNVVWMGKN